MVVHANAVVVCRFEGTGRVWPKGHHTRSGRVIKSGPAGGWLVQIFRPIKELDRETGHWETSHVITCSEDELEVFGGEGHVAARA